MLRSPLGLIGILSLILVLVSPTVFGALNPAAPTPSHDPTHLTPPVEAAAASPTISSVRSGAWSDPGTWGLSRIPQRGDDVLVSAGTEVDYDVAVASELRSLTISGLLRFSRTVSTVLEAGNVTVGRGGYLEVGTRAAPIPRGVTTTIRLVATADGQSVLDVAGRWELHGAPLAGTWTRLAADAPKGATLLRLMEPVDWQPGDRIVVAATGRNRGESEENVVHHVAGNTVFLDRPLRFAHSGTSPTQAEVGDLTRNVVVTSKDPRFRGHTRYLMGAAGSISYAEFVNLGAKGQLGKYPIHFHMVGDSMAGSSVIGAAVWNSGNRFVTIHQTNNVTVRDTVGFRAAGHGFFLETGAEFYNTLEHNLGLIVEPSTTIDSDRFPAIYWLPNPLNRFVNNVAVSARGHGFDLKIDEAKLPAPGGAEMMPASIHGPISARQLPILTFDGNVAHSNGGAGLRLYRLNNRQQTSTFQNLLLYRNGLAGLELTGTKIMVQKVLAFGHRLADLRLDTFSSVFSDVQLPGELQPGLPSAPIGILVAGTQNRFLRITAGNHNNNVETAAGDIVVEGRGFQPFVATIEDSVLRSEHPIVFGYPLNSKSFIDVQRLNGSGDSFQLRRFDVKVPEGSCMVDPTFVALRCDL